MRDARYVSHGVLHLCLTVFQNTKGYKARFGTLGANIEDVCRQVHASLDEGEELDPNRLKILEDLNKFVGDLLASKYL